MKYQLQEKSFSFQNQENKTKNINKFETKYDHNATKSSTSIIKTLQMEQKKNIDNKFETKIDMFKKDIQKEPSIIRMLKNQQEKIKNIDDKFKRKIEQESIIKMLKRSNIQEKMKDINNKFEIKTKIKEKPSIIKMLKQEKQLKSIYKQKRKIKNIDKRLYILLRKIKIYII